MRHKESYSIYPAKVAEHISLLKYSKSSCGVDFLLNTAESSEKPGWFNLEKRYKTDFFEFYFFRKAEGYMLLSGRKIELHPNMVLVVSPFQIQEWHVDYTFLIFQEEFINNFLSDKYFMYRLLYCYQHDYPTFFDMPKEDMATYLTILQQMKRELHNPVADSYHILCQAFQPSFRTSTEQLRIPIQRTAGKTYFREDTCIGLCGDDERQQGDTE